MNNKTKIQKIDESMINDYHYLNTNDICFFFTTYAAGYNWSYGDNSIVYNIKKSPEKKDLPEWQYKENAINQFAEYISTIEFNTSDLVFIPIPTSKREDHIYFDNRIEESITRSTHKDKYLKYFYANSNREPDHMCNSRSTEVELRNNISILDGVNIPTNNIILVDDVITTGKNYKVCKELLLQNNPNYKIAGLFLARTIRPKIENENI